MKSPSSCTHEFKEEMKVIKSYFQWKAASPLMQNIPMVIMALMFCLIALFILKQMCSIGFAPISQAQVHGMVPVG